FFVGRARFQAIDGLRNVQGRQNEGVLAQIITSRSEFLGGLDGASRLVVRERARHVDSRFAKIPQDARGSQTLKEREFFTESSRDRLGIQIHAELKFRCSLAEECFVPGGKSSVQAPFLDPFEDT